MADDFERTNRDGERVRFSAAGGHLLVFASSRVAGRLVNAAFALEAADVAAFTAWLAAAGEGMQAEAEPPPISAELAIGPRSQRVPTAKGESLPACPVLGKVIFPTRAACTPQIDFLTKGVKRRRGTGMKKRIHAEAFRCVHCGGWHIGTKGGVKL